MTMENGSGKGDSSENQAVCTLESVFEDWIEFRKSIRTDSTVRKDIWIWEKFYKGTEFARTDIRTFHVPDVTKWLIETAESNGLTKLKYREFKGLLNAMLDYCEQMEFVSRNVARSVHSTISIDKFAPEREKTLQEEVFLDDDREEFENACLAMYECHKNVAYLGILLNFHLGIRVGELTTIKVSDIDFEHYTLTLVRSESMSYCTRPDGRYLKDKEIVVPRLKNRSGKRVLDLSDKAVEMFRRIIKENRENGYEGDWLLVNLKGERVTGCYLNNCFHRAKKKAQSGVLTRGGNHMVRKTVLSQLAHVLDKRQLQDYAGHKDFSTTMKYYLRDMENSEEKRKKINTVI